MAENLSNILRRNDIKKSDAYQSGFLEETTPAYETYMKLKKVWKLQLSKGGRGMELSKGTPGALRNVI